MQATTGFDRIEAVCKILNEYAAAKIDEYEGGSTVYEVDWASKILRSDA